MTVEDSLPNPLIYKGENMLSVDLLLFWTATAFYGIAILVFLGGHVVQKDKALDLGIHFITAGLVGQTASLALRWYYSGHMPGNNIYELNLVGGWFTVLFFVLLQRFYPNTKVLGTIVLAITLVMMLYGYFKPHSIGTLSDEYQSHWFYVHIISAFLAYSCYVIATSAAILYLGKEYNAKMAANERLPGQEFLEDLNSRFVMYGFGGHAVMLASGSIWANTAWGSYWSWDPVETWSLVTWLIYGFHLHAGSFLGWKGDRLAWTSILALIAIIFTFWGVPHLPSG